MKARKFVSTPRTVNTKDGPPSNRWHGASLHGLKTLKTSHEKTVTAAGPDAVPSKSYFNPNIENTPRRQNSYTDTPSPTRTSTLTPPPSTKESSPIKSKLMNS